MFMTGKYLIRLEGGRNDVYHCVVGPASWAYINTPRPDFGRATRVTEAIPAEVRAEFSFPNDVPATCEVTIGSYENDRVLGLLEGFSHSYERPEGEFEDYYHGCVY